MVARLDPRAPTMTIMQRYVDVFLSPSTQHYISNSTMVGIWWHQFSAVFWDSDFWLPAGIEWKDIEPSEEFQYPVFHDVWVYPLLLGAALLLGHYFFLEPFILEPLAQAAAIPNRRARPPLPSKTLEKLYYKYGMNCPRKAVVEASNSTDLTVRQVERWLRRRSANAQSTKYEKFIECGFNIMCHIGLTTFGWVIMFSKPWLWDISLCWENYPHHNVDDDVWWYYTIGLAYFWASAFMQLPAPGRSVGDKVRMMLHHLFTILLMVFSWTCNFVRVGTIVLLIHECVDIPLLAAKMLVYADKKGPTDVIFAIFLVSWAVTRCYLYPFWIMRSVFVDAIDCITMPASYLFKALLIGLLILNAVWTVLIVGVVVRKVRAGSLQDVRSGGEELSEDEEPIINGTKSD